MGIYECNEAAVYTHLVWKRDVARGLIPPATLPAKLVRVSDRSCEPPVILGQRRQGYPASAPERAAGERPASFQTAIEHWAFAALEKPSETELAIRAKFWQQAKEFYRQLQAMSPGQLAEFLGENLAPLPVPLDLKPKNPEREQTDNHLDWSI